MPDRHERCGACRWWDQERYAGPKESGFGYCRGAPPSATETGMGRFPIVGDQDYCATFTPTARVEQIAEHAAATRTLDSPPLA